MLCKQSVRWAFSIHSTVLYFYNYKQTKLIFGLSKFYFCVKWLSWYFSYNYDLFTIKVKIITTNSTNPCFILATFGRVSSVHFQAIMMKKISYKYYNNHSWWNGNVQSHDQEENKLNSTIDANSGVPTFTHD